MSPKGRLNARNAQEDHSVTWDTLSVAKGCQQRPAPAQQTAASTRGCSSAGSGTIGFAESNHPDGPKADERNGDEARARLARDPRRD